MWRPPNVQKHALNEAIWPTASEAEKSLLFSPIQVGPITLKQRTWVPAMVPWRATENGEVTDALIEWYARFAEGRPGALVVEATGIRDIPSGPLLRIGDDRYIPGLSRLVDAVKEASAGETKVLIQLIDFLRVRRRPKPAVYFQRFFELNETHRRKLREILNDEDWLTADEDRIRSDLADLPSHIHEHVLTSREWQDLMYGARERVNDLHLPHIRDLPKQLPSLFSAAAVRARHAGFDGVELHYAHAYTMASFLSRTNERTDGYGSDLAGRLRCPLEVYEAVRSAVGKQFTVGCRYLVDEVIEGGSCVNDAIEIGLSLGHAGMDFLSLSKGGKFDDARPPKVGAAVYPYTGQSGYECMPTVYSDTQGPFFRNVHLMAKVKSALLEEGLTTPIVIAGGINVFERAESILQANAGDIVASARQSLADPDWFLKIRQGRGSDIRRCIYKNYCEALDNRHLEVTCQLWDRVHMDESGVRLSKDGKRRLTPPSDALIRIEEL